jgi:hypothetical protein
MRWVSTILLFMGLNYVYSQTNADSLIRYDDNFKFTEGVFPNFESVKRNKPIPKGRLLSDYSYDDNDFFEKVLLKKYVYYYDNLGNKLKLETRNIWGYSRNGNLFIHVGGNFSRITLVGSISHFIAYKTTESYNSNSPYYNPYYPSYPYYNSTPTTSTVMLQYLLDFKTGRLVIYDVEGLEVLLMNDPELYDEYSQLSKKKKKQMKFLYIRKYNERNPLYFLKE